MIIGIISDTHDNLPKIEKAIRFFNKQKVEFVLHAGDFIAPFTIAKFKSLSCNWQGVFGNNDGEKNGLSSISEGRIKEDPLSIQLDNRKITLIHDINKIDPQDLEKADVVIFGHTHKPEVRRQDDLLFINPGECGGWLTGKSTVALVDLMRLRCQISKI